MTKGNNKQILRRVGVYASLQKNRERIAKVAHIFPRSVCGDGGITPCVQSLTLALPPLAFFSFFCGGSRDRGGLSELEIGTVS